MPKHRIACVFEHPTLSGGERSCLEVLRRLSKRGFEFQAFAPGAGPLYGALAALAISTHPFERVRRSDDEASPAEHTARALASIVEADLIHGNWYDVRLTATNGASLHSSEGEADWWYH